MTKHAFTSYLCRPLLPEDRLCARSHYAAIVDAQKDVQIYQLGDLDCADCLRRMVDKHAALIAIFYARLASLCGKPTESPRALCHACFEMVEVIDGKLAPHHGESGDGCTLNDADAQIYLHPLAAGRIADLEASLVFGVRSEVSNEAR